MNLSPDKSIECGSMVSEGRGIEGSLNILGRARLQLEPHPSPTSAIILSHYTAPHLWKPSGKRTVLYAISNHTIYSMQCCSPLTADPSSNISRSPSPCGQHFTLYHIVWQPMENAVLLSLPSVGWVREPVGNYNSTKWRGAYLVTLPETSFQATGSACHPPLLHL